MIDALAYIPMDRRHALATGHQLPDRTNGAALFADISGFTPLTEALVRELGPQRGAEELTRYLNLVYDAVIDEVHRFGGSVIAFAGDAITCWLEGDDGRRATACALAMQTAMQPFAAIETPAGSPVSLAMKAAVAAGPARRFLIGDPSQRVIDALAGVTLVHLANAEHLAKRGETVVDAGILTHLPDLLEIAEVRQDEQTARQVGVVSGLRAPVAAAPWPALPADALTEAQMRVWLLPQVYERLRHGLGNFLAELRPTVACFLRFTGIDYDDDDAAGQKLDAYIRWVQEIVARYEGTLIDLNIGDKGSYLYINFGAPLAHEDNADRAAAAALALRAGPALDYIAPVQIGMSQGRMRAGAYGGTNHRTYGVLGDEVNMAARLMMAAQPGQIVVSVAAQRSLSQSFVLEALPPIRVKGKSEPAIIFALVSAQQVQRLASTATAYTLPMIGRQEELASITTQMARAQQRQGQIISLSGEAGLGKSRLVAEVVAWAAAQGFGVYGGECESYGINSSYLVWQSVWRGIFAIESTWAPAQQISELGERLRQINRMLPSRLPLLGTLLNLEIPETAVTQSLDAKLRKTLLETMLVECLRATARQRPLVLVLEACQWLDPLSFDLLEVLAQAIADVPVVLLLTYRAEGERLRNATFASKRYHTAYPLAPFTPAEATHFVHAKLTNLIGDATTVPASFTARIIQQAEGNPFYIEELINYLHYRNVDFRDSNALDQVELPDSLQRLVLSHVDQLSESQKITIKVASVIGRIFRAAWLYGVYPELGDASRIQSDLETLYQQEWVQHEAGQAELIYLFRQVITQSVTYESLPHALKAVLHQEIGEFIEQHYGSALDQYLDLLAYHYDRSNDEQKRRYYLRRAGEAAQVDYANTVAIDYFTRLLPLLPEEEQPAILLAVGKVFDTVGDYEAANTHFQTALTQATAQQKLDLVAQSQLALGELRRKQSRYDEAATYFTQAQALAEQLNDETNVSKALVCAGSLALYRGDYSTAHQSYTAGLAIRRRLDDQSQVANTLSDLAITVANQGDLAASGRLFAESLAIRRALDNQWGVANSLNNLGELALMQELYPEAHSHLEEAVTIYRTIGDKWNLANAILTLGNVLRAQGDYPAAYPLYQESIQIYRDLGDRRSLAYLLESIGGLLSLQGEAIRALRLAGAATTLRERLQTPLSPAEQGQLDQALEPARQAVGTTIAAATWQAGRDLTLEEAIAEALGE